MVPPKGEISPRLSPAIGKKCFDLKKPQTISSTKPLRFLAQNGLFQFIAMSPSALGQLSFNLYSYCVLLTYRGCNSHEKSSTDCLCQIPTSNQPSVLHSCMKSAEPYQRRKLLAPYRNIRYTVQSREPQGK